MPDDLQDEDPEPKAIFTLREDLSENDRQMLVLEELSIDLSVIE